MDREVTVSAAAHQQQPLQPAVPAARGADGRVGARPDRPDADGPDSGRPGDGPPGVIEPDGLLNLIRTQLPEFTRTVTEKMLIYALRRGLESYDQRTVKSVQAAVAADDYRFRTMVHEVARSLPFQARRGENVTLTGGSRR